MLLPNEESSVLDFPRVADAVIEKTQTRFSNYIFVNVNGIKYSYFHVITGP